MPKSDIGGGNMSLMTDVSYDVTTKPKLIQLGMVQERQELKRKSNPNQLSNLEPEGKHTYTII